MSKAADLANLIGNIDLSSSTNSFKALDNLNNGGGGANRNLVINGAMNVAQRGSSSTGTGYKTVDRFQMGTSGVDNDPTQAQVDVASGTTPYTLGLRKAYKITNANQSSGANAPDIIDIKYIFEAQDVATSGWNYNSSSSYVTLSFWVKSSVAQNFFGHVKTYDGTVYNYPFSTGSLTADTWTKVTKTIPGNSNLTINNDNGQGLEIRWALFYGTDRTASVTEDAWATYDNTQRTPDNTSTWYTTNSATFEITGVQLEVGQNPTEFEHEPFEGTQRKCYRYYYKSTGYNLSLANATTAGFTFRQERSIKDSLPVRMRTSPAFTAVAGITSLSSGGITTYGSVDYVVLHSDTHGGDLPSADYWYGGYTADAEL